MCDEFLMFPLVHVELCFLEPSSLYFPELWMEIRDTVQEAVIKTFPRKKKCKKAKWLSEEALQIAEKKR